MKQPDDNLTAELVDAEDALARELKGGRGSGTRFGVQLARVAGIRARLGELAESKELYGRAAEVFDDVPSDLGREWAAFARIMEANVASAQGRWDEAAGILDRLVRSRGGFPQLQQFPGGTALGLDIWMAALEQSREFDRLSGAAEVALSLLDPSGPEKERRVIARATRRKALAMAACGQSVEAVEFFDRSIALFEAEDVSKVGKELIEVTAQRAQLVADLGLQQESAASLKQMISTAARVYCAMPARRLFRFRPRRSKQ